MQTSAHIDRADDGRRVSSDRRRADLRSGDKRRCDIDRRLNVMENFRPENRLDGNRRDDQSRRNENRRVANRRSGIDRRDLH